ncbi:MAG TPA: 6-hydroxymethylpterin diphosphokinase MptE-like protein [Chlamydiales bacterium]|nr:6-hydroxymethylpterin diphosphokinase MptE-like protein [Chlamydiales bacterium]
MEKALSMFEENHAILMERFPKLALEIPLARPTSQARESLGPLHLVNVKALYIYGIGQGEGYFETCQWLKSDSSRRLIVLENDLSQISAFLHSPEAKTVLKDPQVILATLDQIDELVERFPFSHVEAAALPSKRRFKKWKERLLQRNAFSYALHNERIHGYQPFQNFVSNVRRMSDSFYANGLFGKFQDVPAVVCGAGPSLQEAIPLLRTLENKALLIAGGSTLAALSSEGVTPHFGMALDPNLEEYRRLKNSFAFEVPFLYSTRVFPSIFHTANGPFGYMRSGIGGAVEIWMEEELGLFDPLIGEKLSSDAISVTSICLAWAQFLGCNPIFLSGLDLAYTKNRRYASGVAEEELDIHEIYGSVDRLIKRKDRQGRPICTAIRWLMESAAFSHFAKMHPKTKFINTTEGGIGFTNIPYIPLDEALDGYVDCNFSLRGKVHQAIIASPMPGNTGKIIKKKMGELTKSLEKVVGHLEICAGVKVGSNALAEMELRDEMAFHLLFYDAESVMAKDLQDPNQKWIRFLRLAQQYQYVLQT